MASHPTTIEPNLETAFEQLAQAWRDEHRFMSSVTDMVLLPSYQRIIGLDGSFLERRRTMRYTALV